MEGIKIYNFGSNVEELKMKIFLKNGILRFDKTDKEASK